MSYTHRRREREKENEERERELEEGVYSECLFNDNDSDGVYTMKFNFKQCGTTHASGDAVNLVYYNKVQGQEYYSDVLMGVKVSLSCISSLSR